MSGTSLDGVDAVLLEIGDKDQGIVLRGTYSLPFSSDLKAQLWQLTQSSANEIDVMLRAERALTQCYVQVVEGLLAETKWPSDRVAAIGCHGQTIRHQVAGSDHYTLQIGDMHWLAAHTGIPCVGDFRRMDMALGGQGAPLMPAFHRQLFQHHDEDCVVVNIGGIANVTLLSCDPDQPVIGFDTGPGNGLMDSWVHRHWGLAYDEGGHLAARGCVHEPMFRACMSDPYFSKRPPKSTGRDYFNLDWLSRCYPRQEVDKSDGLATLLHLTVSSIARAIQRCSPNSKRVIVCGGGAKNQTLMGALSALLPGCRVDTSAAYGIDPQWVEASGFAWLAYCRLLGRGGHLPAVTGASRTAVLGAVCLPD